LDACALRQNLEAPLAVALVEKAVRLRVSFPAFPAIPTFLLDHTGLYSAILCPC
jgi:hypothetical protein